MSDNSINTTCRDGCGRSIDDGPQPSGWHFLAVAARWRCPACSLELDEANQNAPALAQGTD